MKKYFLILLALKTSIFFGQVQTKYVKPILTHTSYGSSEDSSAISRNTSFQLNKLFLFIGGTGSSSSTDYNALRLHSANLGFDFINLSYPNNVAAASLANSSDSLTFNKYRQEVCFGTPLSIDVTVDTLNSIYTRTLKLIQYLSSTFPTENWGQYLATPTTLNWSKIIVGGHSQGSGHACFLAKQFSVYRVLMFAGANDYSDFYSNSANWIRQPGITPVIRHYSYLSLNDEAVSYNKQFKVISGLGMLLSDDSTQIDNITIPYGNSHCLYTTQAPGVVILNHNVPIKLSAINNNVWTYMLTSTITTGLDNRTVPVEIEIYPNPSKDFVYLSFQTKQEKLIYSIYNVSGQELKTSTLTQNGEKYMIEISDLNTGLYTLKVNGKIFKMIKQ
ncbi:MAG: T9SS type A sorting domain-containing protein [Bacteroidetes bacterium]|nr:T9SS type A sorting domain-containing protein [Bacteroidota bacterium]